MKNNLQFSTTDKQQTSLKNILQKNTQFMKVLVFLQSIKVPYFYIGGGCVPQIVWNYYHQFDLNNGIKDFDIVYFDSQNLSTKNEEYLQKRINKRFQNHLTSLEVVNEARTHLWYEKDFGKKIPPYVSTEDAIFSFPTTASAIGATLDKNKNLKIFAPHGLSDLFGLIVRANKIQVSKDIFESKAKRWQTIWPKLTIIPWNYD